ncbi:MAG: tail fiber domain-containing protein, partial [Candidatus Omnitrophota bacterium]
YGVYRELRAKRIAIGDDYIDGANYTWQDTESGSGEVDFNADLVVEGNVGIGTVNPGTSLDIRKDVNIGLAWQTAQLTIGGVANANEKITVGFDTTNNIGMIQAGESGVDFRSLALQPLGGNVGIGTTSPGGRLHVHQDSTNANLVVTGNFAPELRIASSASDLSTSVTFGMATGAGHYLGNAASGDAIVLSRTGNILFGTDNSTERMRISKSSGNVGIGTTNPLALLNVLGSKTGNWVARIENTASSGHGLVIQAGNSASDYSFVVNDGASSKTFFAVLGNGNVGIGTTPTSAKLEVKGSGTTSATYGLIVEKSNGTSNFQIRDDGYGYLAAATWAYGSDRRMKENISYLKNTGALAKIMQLKPARFDYIQGAKNQLGFIAQDVQQVIPEAVSIANPDTGMLGLKTDFIIPYLVNAIKEQENKISIQDAKLDELEKANRALKQRLSSI